MAEEKKVYVEEEQAGSFTLKNYFKGIKRFKWWVIGSTVVCAVLGFIGLKFIINPSTNKLVATYKYELAGTTEDQETYRLVDGSIFNYYDIVSKENLQKVKDSNPSKFKAIDVEKVYSKNAITVEKVVKSFVNNSEDYVDVSFKATASVGAFPSVEIGSAFLYEVINSAKTISTEAINNYAMNCYILDNRANETFEKQINALTKQYNQINNTYGSLQSLFGTSANTGVDNKRLYEMQDLFRNRYDEGTVNSVKLTEGAWKANQFVNYKEGKETEKIAELHTLARSYIKALHTYESDYDAYSVALQELAKAQNINMTDSEYIARCLELEGKVTSNKQQIDKIKDQLDFYGYEEVGNEWKFEPTKPSAIKKLTDKDPSWVADNKAFAGRLESLAVSLLADRDTATTVYKNTYSLYSNKVTLSDSGYVSLEKHISSVLGAPIGAVVGFLISSIVTTFVYAYKVKKED